MIHSISLLLMVIFVIPLVCIEYSNKPIPLFHMNYQKRFVVSYTFTLIFFKQKQRRLFILFKFCNLNLEVTISVMLRRKVDRKLDSSPPFFIACQLSTTPAPRNLSTIEARNMILITAPIIMPRKALASP